MSTSLVSSTSKEVTAEVLPLAPTDQEKTAYIERRSVVLVFFSLVSFVCLMISQVTFSLQAVVLWVYMPLITFTILYYVISVSVSFGTKNFDLTAHYRTCWEWTKRRKFPSVDVFLPFVGESAAVLQNTWQHVRNMVDAYPGLMTVYCLDDKGRAETTQMALDFGFTYLSRPNKGETKKAGNLKFGFENSRGEFVMVFDADFCPRPDMPEHMLPYFANPNVGIVQTPQYFRVRSVQTWLERAAGAVQELFYRTIQTSRNQHDGAICVGTNAIYRRRALEENGGPTQIGHSEDVHTGFDLKRFGWMLVYLPINLAMGTCPNQLAAFLTQQYRWCMGSMSLLTSRKFWQTKLRLRSRLCFLSGFFYYIHTAVFTFVMPTIPLVLLIVLPELVLWQNYLFILPSLFYTLVVFPMWHRQSYGLGAFAAKMIYGWAHTFAIIDALRGKPMGWVATGNAGAKTSLLAPFKVGLVIWGGGTTAAWLGLVIWRMSTHNVLDFLPMLVSGLLYGAVVAQCLMPNKARVRV